MQINLVINGVEHELEVTPAETLFAVLRRLGFQGVKFGDEQGLSGSDTVILDGKPVNADYMLAAQAEGHKIATIESLGEVPDQGWKKTNGLHPLQLAFIQSGAIQCGYCTPAQILAAKALLDKNPNPTEAEVREAIAGVLCRCTGYTKPVQAILQAAEMIRNGKETGGSEAPAGFARPAGEVPSIGSMEPGTGPADMETQTRTTPKIILAPET